MSTEAQIDAALEAVVHAARHHRAVLRAGAAEEQVWRAYVALNNATVRYDDLISEVYDEVTPWDCEYLESDGEAPPEPAVPPVLPPADVPVPVPDGGALLVSVRHRRDYVVPQPSRLLALATEARRTSWAAVDATHAARPVTEVGEAVNELVQAGDGTVAALDAYPEELVPGNGVLVVNALRRPLTFADTPATAIPDPLLLGPDEAQLYRMDEEIVDEDSLDEPAAAYGDPTAPRGPVNDPAASLW
ncbi:hypothetical protein [Cryptosporangium aurantiacum]|uniref:Uncharacterized protein n=1 Tax=Cryptosporangium aurantiacum TaxID=134849 RepID=A0A1M7RII7_9ACTN|nr:hypothetical protein [Cryptosporangium aurantiacum]SHN45961.1 hypothetical protein SAMN05443668_113106 [Cryptosporangium aurantiacum]